MEPVALQVHRAMMLAIGPATGRKVGLRQQGRTDARHPDEKQQTGQRATHKHVGLYYITKACDALAPAKEAACCGHRSRPMGVATDWQLQ